jgi:hypothetical protein
MLILSILRNGNNAFVFFYLDIFESFHDFAFSLELIHGSPTYPEFGEEVVERTS